MARWTALKIEMEYRKIALFCLVVFLVAMITFVAAPSVISAVKSPSSTLNYDDENSASSTTSSCASSYSETFTSHVLSLNVSQVYYDAADSPADHSTRLLIYDLTLSNTGKEDLTLNSQDFFLIAYTFYNSQLTGTYSYSNFGVPVDVAPSTRINGTFSIGPGASISGLVAYQVQLNNQPSTIEYNDSITVAYAYNVPLVPVSLSALNHTTT